MYALNGLALPCVSVHALDGLAHELLRQDHPGGLTSPEFRAQGHTARSQIVMVLDSN